jgi:flagellar basal-body rod protein FlgF
MYMSATGANAQSHRLEVLSHNLANINTTGFKPHLAVLQTRQSKAIQNGEVSAGQGGVDDLSAGVAIKPTLTQYQQGAIKTTGSSTDLAIHDPSTFFVVQRNDKELLTRDGNFMFDNQGQLVTPNGDPVLSAGGGKIRIDPRQPYTISSDGAVVQGSERQLVKLVRPQALGDLTRIGDNMFQSLASVNEVSTTERKVTSGALESSAVEPTSAMIELIEASRVYEANVRMIQTQNDSMEQLISRILR